MFCMKKINVSVRQERSGKSVQVLLEGELVLGQIEAVQQTLLSVMSKHEIIMVSLQGLVSLDVSGIQLLHAARRMAVELGKQCIFKKDFPNELRQVVEQAGITQLIT